MLAGKKVGVVSLVLALGFVACGYDQPARIGRGDVNDAGDPDAFVLVPDARTDCLCSGTTLDCPEADFTCAATCVATPAPHCSQLQPSNTVDRTLLSQVSTKITVSAATAIDSGTGAISGGITRAAGTGVTAGILYAQVGNLGVFVFDELTIDAGITLRVFGSRPAVFLVGKTVLVNGIIDASGDQGTIYQAGAGGGTGGTGSTVAGGCGPGGAGNKSGTELSDSGGGGGGGGASGARGGKAAAQAGGTAGAPCIPLTLEPLVGGSGGGQGGIGTSPRRAYGGGGGGALQISSLEGITISGTIDVGGAGGEGGQGDTAGTVKNAGGGAGGGSGGALLLEAPVVIVNTGAVLSANGGAGGGAADSASTGTTGDDAKRSASVAVGGPAAGAGTDGGNGGAGATAAQNGADTNDNTTNTGGGGGGVGKIFIRAYTTPTLSGTVSPIATTGAFRAD
jgi:hypothetical protein